MPHERAPQLEAKTDAVPKEIGVAADFDSLPGNVIIAVQHGRTALPVKVILPLVALKAIAGQALLREAAQAAGAQLEVNGQAPRIIRPG